MELNPIGPNMTEVSVNGWRILFSYRTPVAAWGNKIGFIRTSKKWSVTTSRHINKWLDGSKAKEVDQSVFSNIAGSNL